MNTRSQTSYELNAPFTVDINFDEASMYWKMNKKAAKNATYTYVCIHQMKSGRQCTKKPLANCDYCKEHNSQNNLQK